MAYAIRRSDYEMALRVIRNPDLYPKPVVLEAHEIVENYHSRATFAQRPDPFVPIQLIRRSK